MGRTTRAAHINNPFQSFGAPAGNTLNCIGDSFNYRDRWQDATTYRWTQGTGHMGWMQQFLSHPPLITSFEGIQGEKWSQMAARFTDVIHRYPARFTRIQGWTNDVNAMNSLADADRDFKIWRDKFVRPVLDRGGIPIVNTPPPSNLTALSNATRIKCWKYIGEAVRDYAMTQGGIGLVDWSANTYLDPTDTNGVLALLASVAGAADLHPFTLGALQLGRAEAAVIESLQPINFAGVTNYSDYNAIVNPMMAGTGGANGTGSSGDVADDWTVETHGGGTTAVVASKVAASDGGNPWQQISFTTAAAPAIVFGANILSDVFTLSGSEFAVGDLIHFGNELQVDSGHTGILGVGCYVTQGGATYSALYSRRSVNAGSDITFSADELIGLKSCYAPPIAIQPGTTTMRFGVRVYCKPSVSSDIVIRVRNPFIRHAYNSISRPE